MQAFTGFPKGRGSMPFEYLENKRRCFKAAAAAKFKERKQNADAAASIRLIEFQTFAHTYHSCTNLPKRGPSMAADANADAPPIK
jgi:hypothetical protein